MVEVSPTLSKPPPAGVLRNIQALRALAAFMVVFVHLEAFALRLGGGPETFVAGNGGVDLFFVISGLIMVYTTLDRPTTPHGFIGQRLARIAPLYWLVTLAVFAIAVAAPSLMQATRADPVELVKSLLFVPFTKSNGLTQPVAFVGWTLNYEMAFYAVFALGLLAPRRWIGAAFAGAVIALAVAAGVALQPKSTLGAFYTAPIMLEFVFGMILGLILRRLPSGRGAAAACGALIAPLFVLMLLGPALWPGVDRAVMFGLPGAGIVLCALVLERSGAVLRTGWVQRLGDASYAVYLTHFFVTQAAVKVTDKLGLTGPVATILALIATLVGVAVVGVAVHLLIERPLAKAVRRLRPRRPAAISAAGQTCASA